MKQTLDHLRNQPHHAKHLTALTFAIGVGVILAILWGISIASPKFNLTSSDIRAFNAKEDPMVQSLQAGFETITTDPVINQNLDSLGEDDMPTFDETSPYASIDDTQNL